MNFLAVPKDAIERAWPALSEGIEGLLKINLGTDTKGKQEVETALVDIERAVTAAEMQQMLGGEHDASNAIVSLHPGAGGLEAQRQRA